MRRVVQRGVSVVAGGCHEHRAGGVRFSQAAATALFSVVEAPPPRLIGITLAPRWWAQTMQAATSDVMPVPAAVQSALQIVSRRVKPHAGDAGAVVRLGGDRAGHVRAVHVVVCAGTRRQQALKRCGAVDGLAAQLCVGAVDTRARTHWLDLGAAARRGRRLSRAASQPSGASMPASSRARPVCLVSSKPRARVTAGRSGTAVARRM